MGLLLSILFSYAGAIEFMFIVRDIVHRIGLHHEKMKFNRNQSNVTSTLHDLQEDLRKSIKVAKIQLYETDCIHSMADGIQYTNGYRILSSSNEENSEKQCLESNRAMASIEPAHIIDANDVVTSIVNENQNKNDVISFTNVQRTRSNSKIKDSNDNEIAIDMNHPNGNDNRELPNIHFDEYKRENSYNYDDNVAQMSESQQQIAEPGRRKSFKVNSNTGSHMTNDEFQRRHSKDIDGKTDNPWGELRPENFHDGNLWSRERAMSIAENEESIGCVNEKSNNTNSKQDVNALDRASTTASTMRKNDNGVLVYAKKNGKTFGEPDETYESDVSSEIPSSLPHCFDEVTPACDSRAVQIRNVPEILVDGLEIGEDYTIDDNDIELDKNQFNEYAEKPERSRHSSYNYEIDVDNEEELNEFSIVRKNEDEDEGDEAANLANVNKSIDTKNEKQGRKGRKPNMFASSFGAIGSSSSINNDDCSTNDSNSGGHEHGEQSEYHRPLVRITSTEDKRVEHFLQEEHIKNTQRNGSGGGSDILIKSKTTQMFECSNECVSDADSCESRANSVASPIDVTRRESMVSDVGSEPIQFECKQPESPNYFYNREDSSSSYKSNVLFERSQSHFSELEYIKGRDDWKDDYIRHSISEEIDSDNYHHLRRHSEAADTLEYIRGREDWLLRNGTHRNHHGTSLAQIFEVGEPKLFIQDEIDSDEYHHNFFQHEAFHTITGIMDAQINKSLGDCKHSATTVPMDFQEQFVTTAATENMGDNINCSEITVTTNLNNVHNESHPIVIPNDILFDKSNEIDVVIEDLIKHDTIDNDDIEITVWNLTPESHKNNPFIFISETAADNQDIPNDERNLNQSIGLLHPDYLDSPISADSTPNTVNIDPVSECNDTENDCQMFQSNSSNNNNNNTIINEFLNTEIQCETKNRPIIRYNEMEKENENENEIKIESMCEQKLEYKRGTRAKSERLNSMTTVLLDVKEQKPRRTLSFENVEDLVADVSNGPWFHK